MKRKLERDKRGRFKKGHKEGIGRVVSEETRQKMRDNSLKNPIRYWLGKKRTDMADEKHYFWKGDKAGKLAMHKWIERKFGKPNYCEHCKRTDRKKYEWCSNDHKYSRNIEDYMRLCTSCHRKYDIRFLTKWKYKNCIVCGNGIKTKNKKQIFCHVNCSAKYYYHRDKIK